MNLNACKVDTTNDFLFNINFFYLWSQKCKSIPFLVKKKLIYFRTKVNSAKSLKLKRTFYALETALEEILLYKNKIRSFKRGQFCVCVSDKKIYNSFATFVSPGKRNPFQLFAISWSLTINIPDRIIFEKAISKVFSVLVSVWKLHTRT